MSDVRRLADELLERYERIDVLANNAGALFASRQVTQEGFEQTFALNHLAPFLLTNLLRERLRGGRVVTTASDAHRAGRLDFEDLQSERSYSPMRVYGTSKLCNILFTRELAKRAKELRANVFTLARCAQASARMTTALLGSCSRSPDRSCALLSEEPVRLYGWRCLTKQGSWTDSTSKPKG